jgi:hypothetical protein
LKIIQRTRISTQQSQHHQPTKPVYKRPNWCRTYDKIFERTLPIHMVSCIDYHEYDILPLDTLTDITVKNPVTGVFLGNDMRPIGMNHDEISIEKINEINTNHKLLTTLENTRVSLAMKTKLCDNYNKNRQSYTTNLLGGGLMDDFDFILFT